MIKKFFFIYFYSLVISQFDNVDKDVTNTGPYHLILPPEVSSSRSSYNIPDALTNTPGSSNTFHNSSKALNRRSFQSNKASRTDNSYCSNNALASTPPTLPVNFHEMDTIHQLCTWLCANPNVLQLAYNMYLSMQLPVADGSGLISRFSPTLMAVPQVSNQMPNQEVLVKQ